MLNEATDKSVTSAGGVTGVDPLARHLEFTLLAHVQRTVFAEGDDHVTNAAGDEGAITIDPGSGKYVPFDPAGSGGAQTAAGILVEDVDATNANVDVAGAAVVRHAQIAPSGLTFKVAATDAQIAAALTSLRAKGILTVREA